MWICSQLGFYSIVEKPVRTWMVRARVKDDLARLLRAAFPKGKKPRLIETLDSDYQFRIVLDRQQYSVVMKALEESVDYPNFKGRIYALAHQKDKAHAYTDFHGALWRMQCAGAATEKG